MGARLLLFFLLLSPYLSSTYGEQADGPEDKEQVYIVYMGQASTTISTNAVYTNMLNSVFGDVATARKNLVHSYGKSINAFAARLLPAQAERIKAMDGVVSVFTSKIRKLHTTRSYDYIGLTQNVQRNLEVESDVIIGVLDTGIWVDSPSFNDKGLGPPPAKWKGVCQKVGNFTGCNNKLIGARYFALGSNKPVNEEISPADFEGHGTHTASTAAGVTVDGTNLYGLGNGTARGAVPAARIAVYKVCWGRGCADVDILAAFDAAIADGVDVLSLSLGGSESDFFSDAVAIGAFHASKKGIFVACSAGNEGPNPGTVSNNAPWILTVGASSTDRQVQTDVVLGNGKNLRGISMNTYSPRRRLYPLITGAAAANTSVKGNAFINAKNCDLGTLDKNKVKGKIVVCIPSGFGGEDASVSDAGGSGIIVVKNTRGDTAFNSKIPAADIALFDYTRNVSPYINSTKNPQAVIFKTRMFQAKARPTIASFSSRGPSPQTKRLLKPDLVAPGLHILAAFSPKPSISGAEGDNRHAGYNFMSGTSMSCPHAAGIAAYVKSFHPNWSPAAIKSALITTARNILVPDELGAFSTGAGMINPTAALSPGLVYDAGTQEYIDFLCKEGYSGIRLETVTGENANCTSAGKLNPGVDGVNYPSMQYFIEQRDRPIYAVFHRQVTNVGPSNSVYNAQVKASGFNITVIPNTLTFTSKIKQGSFKVVVAGPPLGTAQAISGEVVWSDAAHRVRSPVVVYGSTDGLNGA